MNSVFKKERLIISSPSMRERAALLPLQYADYMSQIRGQPPADDPPEMRALGREISRALQQMKGREGALFADRISVLSDMQFILLAPDPQSDRVLAMRNDDGSETEWPTATGRWPYIRALSFMFSAAIRFSSILTSARS